MAVSADYRHMAAAQLRRLWLKPSDRVGKVTIEKELLERGLTGPQIGT
jgi:hypothetical protein